MLTQAMKLDWPAQLERGDRIKAVRYGLRDWRVRVERRTIVKPFFFRKGVLYTYWPDGRKVIEISGQTLLGTYRTRKAAEAVCRMMKK